MNVIIRDSKKRTRLEGGNLLIIVFIVDLEELRLLIVAADLALRHESRQLQTDLNDSLFFNTFYLQDCNTCRMH